VSQHIEAQFWDLAVYFKGLRFLLKLSNIKVNILLTVPEASLIFVEDEKSTHVVRAYQLNDTTKEFVLSEHTRESAFTTTIHSTTVYVN